MPSHLLVPSHLQFGKNCHKFFASQGAQSTQCEGLSEIWIGLWGGGGGGNRLLTSQCWEGEGGGGGRAQNFAFFEFIRLIIILAWQELGYLVISWIHHREWDSWSHGVRISKWKRLQHISHPAADCENSRMLISANPALYFEKMVQKG